MSEEPQLVLERLQAKLADRYIVEREIGRGGMAVVYLARDCKSDRLVALKVLLPDLSSVLGPERFRREIQVASQLNHPHILPIYDSGEVDGSLFYAMPYIQGESLRARLDRERQLPVPDALRITGEVADALDHAHRHGVVHRDIKPENILLGEDGEAVVADFGIARAVSSVGDERLTKTGMTLGTPLYMSPEQATAERNLDGRADIYALGCVLYEMLAGTPPFTGPNAQAITARHIMDEPPNITTIRRTVPMHVEQTIRVALAKVPADRFARASDFVAALRDVSGGAVSKYTASISVPRLSGAQVAASRGLSRRALAAMVLAPVFLVVAGLAAWQFGPLRSASGTSPGGASGGSERVAVMYFEDKSGGDLEFLADGLTEALIQELARMEAVDVVSAAGVLPFRGSTALDTVARKLRAGLVVRGSVAPQDDKISVTLRLVNANDETAGREPVTFSVPAADLLAAREAVTIRATQLILPQVGRTVALAESRSGTRSAAAWAALQRAELARKVGRRLYAADSVEAASREFARADSLMRAAEEADPRWVEPVWQRARLAYQRSRSGDRTASARWTEIGLEHADRALSMEPRNPDALEVRGTLRYSRWLANLETEPRAARRLFDSAIQDLTEATTISPRQASAWYVLSQMYAQVPDLVNSASAARRAYESDQFLERAPEILWRLYTIYYSLEQHASARRTCDEGRERFPENRFFLRCQLWLMTTTAAAPDTVRAEELITELEKITPPAHWEYTWREAQMVLAGIMVRTGRPERARSLLASARGNPQVDPDGELMGVEAFVWTMMGDKDNAIATLQRYFLENPSHREGFRGDANWWWRDLLGDPRFQQLTGTGA